MSNLTVSATLNIEITVNCPECDERIDLLSEEDTDNYNHNDEGQIIKQAIPDGDWRKSHKNFKCLNVTCTGCKIDFDVKVLNW